MSKATSEANLQHHILPILGDIPLSKLTREMIETWLRNLAKKEPVKVTLHREAAKKLSPSRRSKLKCDPTDPETIRRRKDTANRVFNDLRALLSAAYRNDRVASDKPWATVEKLQNAAQASREGMTMQEAKRFIEVCPSDFKLLVQAALITGCRYADLCNMRVKAYEPRYNAVEVKQAKTGEWQYSYLTTEESAFFAAQTDGKAPIDHVFLRSDGEEWRKSNQQERMRDTLAAAGIHRHIRFHDLRHSLGQWMAESGMEMKLISKQLGHSSVKVTEHTYVRYTPEYLSKAIPSQKPSFLSQ